jgi:hypothetical protein
VLSPFGGTTTRSLNCGDGLAVGLIDEDLAAVTVALEFALAALKGVRRECGTSRRSKWRVVASGVPCSCAISSISPSIR